MVEPQIAGQQQTRSLPLIILVFVLGIVLLLTFAFAPAVNSVILVNLMEGADQILLKGQPIIDSISDANVKDSINGAISSGITAGVNTVEVNAFLYQFGWIFFVLITLIVIFLITNNKTSSSRSGLV